MSESQGTAATLVVFRQQLVLSYAHYRKILKHTLSVSLAQMLGTRTTVPFFPFRVEDIYIYIMRSWG